ncbi:MAG: 4-alpha-glucanotransferase [Brevinema sp.]
MLNQRQSGILMPIFSLPSDEPIGTLGHGAYEFIDFLADSNQHYWQVLPVGMTSYGDSPYQSYSSYAGNPYFIDLKTLMCKGWLEHEDLQTLKSTTRVDYAILWEQKYPLLRKAYQNSRFDGAEAKELLKKYWWLDDFSTFMALKNHFGFESRANWPEARFKTTLSKDLLDTIQDEKMFHIFIQGEFFEQWFTIKEYAEFKGVELIGDLPIFVSEDSVDLWVYPEYFQLDNNGALKAVAGVPPDYFSEDGQLWGNPLYHWENLEKDGFSWWIDRIGASLKMFHVLRLDHFRGFESYWAVPKNELTARNGSWVHVPGERFFEQIKSTFPDGRMIVEDLGIITPEVEKLIEFVGYPNMRVLLFAFDGGADSPHLPAQVSQNTVYYTATHDNDTVEGWFHDQSRQESISKAQEYFKLNILTQHSMSSLFIEEVWRSSANIAITTMQDLLGLDNESRINTPAILGGNWSWRLDQIPTSKIRKWLAQTTKDTHRNIS